jgi:hypothetical protein
MCLNETYSKVQVGKHLFEMLSIKDGLKKGGTLSLLLSNVALEYVIRKVQAN